MGNDIDRNNITSNDYGVVLMRSSEIEVKENNFIDNNRHAFFQSCRNSWSDNYWDDWDGIRPFYIIRGEYKNFNLPYIEIPLFQFDFRPQKVPNNIS